MHKINIIPPLVFEILSFNNLFGYAYSTHLKSHDQFVALIDMYMHAKNQFHTSNSFEILQFKNPAV